MSPCSYRRAARSPPTCFSFSSLDQAYKTTFRALSLCTSSERAYPIRTLAPPRFRGISATEILRITFRTLVFEPLDNFLSQEGELTLNDLPPNVLAALNFTLTIVLYAGTTLLLLPLDVAKARLAVLYPDVEDEDESESESHESEIGRAHV